MFLLTDSGIKVTLRYESFITGRMSYTKGRIVNV